MRCWPFTHDYKVVGAINYTKYGWGHLSDPRTQLKKICRKCGKATVSDIYGNWTLEELTDHED